MGADQAKLFSLLPPLVPGSLPNEFVTTIRDDAGNEHSYVARRLNTKQGKHLIPVVGRLAASVLEMLANGPAAALMAIAEVWASDVNSELFDKTLMGGGAVTRDGLPLSVPANYDKLAMEGGMGEYMRLIVWLIQVNYAGVFNAGFEMFRALVPLEEEAKPTEPQPE